MIQQHCFLSRELSMSFNSSVCVCHRILRNMQLTVQEPSNFGTLSTPILSFDATLTHAVDNSDATDTHEADTSGRN